MAQCLKKTITQKNERGVYFLAIILFNTFVHAQLIGDDWLQDMVLYIKHLLGMGIRGESLLEGTSNIYAGERLYAQSNSDTQYNHHDFLGSIIAVSDVSGNVIREEAYAPFGVSLGGSDGYGYTGKKFDSNSGLQYVGARWYSPRRGWFMSSDDIEILPNPYTYALNNPYKCSDADGKETKPVSVLFINSKYGEFVAEANEYIANYQDRYDIKVLPVNGIQEVMGAVNEVNALIQEGQEVARIHFFDHSGDRIFGIGLEEWKSIAGITSQTERCSIMGFCLAGNSRDFLREQRIDERFRVSGSGYYVATNGKFYGIARTPVLNDVYGILAWNTFNLDSGEGTFDEIMEKARKYGFPGMSQPWWLVKDIIDQGSVRFIHNVDFEEYMIIRFARGMNSDEMFSFTIQRRKIGVAQPESISVIGKSD